MFRKLTRLVYGEHRGAGTKPFVPKPLPAGEAAVAPGGQSRYLWTDAFGVLNFVTEAARCAEAGDEEGREDALSAAEAAQGVPLVDLFVRLDLGKSKSEVRRLVSGGGARLNDEKVADAGLVVDAAAFGGGRELKLSAGKKKHGIVELAA